MRPATLRQRTVTTNDDTAARTAAARAHRLAEEGDGARTPALAAAVRPLPLANREREIVTLAADGLSNRASAKLGTSARSEFADPCLRTPSSGGGWTHTGSTTGPAIAAATATPAPHPDPPPRRPTCTAAKTTSSTPFPPCSPTRATRPAVADHPTQPDASANVARRSSAPARSRNSYMLRRKNWPTRYPGNARRLWRWIGTIRSDRAKPRLHGTLLCVHAWQHHGVATMGPRMRPEPANSRNRGVKECPKTEFLTIPTCRTDDPTPYPLVAQPLARCRRTLQRKGMSRSSSALCEVAFGARRCSVLSKLIDWDRATSQGATRWLGRCARLLRGPGLTGDPDTAARLLHDVAADASRLGSPPSTNALGLRRQLATWTGEAGDPHDARRQFQELVTIVTEQRGAEDQWTLSLRRHLAHWTGQSGSGGGSAPTGTAQHRRQGRQSARGDDPTVTRRLAQRRGKLRGRRFACGAPIALDTSRADGVIEVSERVVHSTTRLELL
jgi:hypothetical protein